MKLIGESDPKGGDGYVEGAWDFVRDATLDGVITEEAYTTLLALKICYTQMDVAITDLRSVDPEQFRRPHKDGGDGQIDYRAAFERVKASLDILAASQDVFNHIQEGQASDLAELNNSLLGVLEGDPPDEVIVR